MTSDEFWAAVRLGEPVYVVTVQAGIDNAFTGKVLWFNETDLYLRDTQGVETLINRAHVVYMRLQKRWS